ncbi:MAG: PfkB family carbohydrate kinase [Alphaproteobacteria bacterium]
MVDGQDDDRPGGLVIVANSLVARGSVGGRASQFALERAGREVVILPTVLLAWHPGHGPATRIVPERYDAMVADIAAAPWRGRVRAVLSGYLGDAGQARAIAGLVAAVKAANPEAIYVCDPVMGDQRGLYVPQTSARAIGDILVPLADIVTPNASELGWLAGAQSAPAGTDEMTAMAVGLHRPLVAVTSAPTGRTETTGVALVPARGRAWLARHARLAVAPHGTGDLFAALFLAATMARQDRRAALLRATAATFAMVQAAGTHGAGELPLAACAHVLDAADETSVRIEPLATS